jgi:acetyl esterase/lipase
MKLSAVCVAILLCFALSKANAQFKFPDTLTLPHTHIMRNVPYGPNARQNFDLYTLIGAKKPMPLIVWIHGGGWTGGQKSWIEVFHLVQQGYAIASIDYRTSADAVFPAQVRDCNEAIYFLCKNAAKYGFDTSKIVIGGGSAGGHLSALIGTSSNNHVSEFYNDMDKEDKVHIRAVIDFYGPSDLNAVHGKASSIDYDSDSSVFTKLLGAQTLERPDLAAIASPATYIDKNDPPFLIIHGDMDTVVPFWESRLFYSRLKLAGVNATLIKVPGGGHTGPPFIKPDIQQKVTAFLDEVLGKK